MKVHATFRRFVSCPKMSLRYFLACCVFTSCLVAGQTTKYALLGQEVTLIPDLKTHPEEILWKHNKDMVVEFNGQTQQQYGSFEGRVTLDWLSADLSIIHLTFEDSGDYELQTFAKHTLLETFHYTLKVIDRVAKPTISCKMNNGSSSDKPGLQATLTCSTDSQQSQPSLEFSWSSNGKKQIGPKLIIPLGDAHDNQVYNCTVRNKLSEESASFTAKECYSDKSNLTPVIIGVCAGVLLIVLIFVICKLRHKGCSARKKTPDVENQSNTDKTEELENGDEEREVLLGRAPTLPSQQTLAHLVQKHIELDLIHEDRLLKELNQSIKQRSSSGSENQNPDLRTSTSPPVPEKPFRSLDLSLNKDQTNGVPTAEEDNITSSSLLVPEKPPRLHDLPTNDEEQGDEDELGNTVESKEDSKTNDASSENNGTERISNPPPVPKKSEAVRESFRKLNAKPDENNPLEAVEEKPSESSPESEEADVSPEHDSDEKEKAAKAEGNVPLPPVPKPRPRLSSKITNTSPEDEQKQAVSSDHAAGESGKDLPTTPPHEQQPPPPETNPGQEILQEGDKQVPEDKTPDGLSDQKETDLSNTPKEPQSLTSKPGNSKVLESSVTELPVPDDKDEDKTRHNSQNRPEKGDKAEAAEDNDVNQS